MITFRIQTDADLNIVSSKMHDSEFCEKDIGYDSKKHTFQLKAANYEKEFCLKLQNVIAYEPKNLDMVNKGKATAGVFNCIKIRENGNNLAIISQDLQIILKLTKLEGEFQESSKGIAN